MTRNSKRPVSLGNKDGVTPRNVASSHSSKLERQENKAVGVNRVVCLTDLILTCQASDEASLHRPQPSGSLRKGDKPAAAPEPLTHVLGHIHLNV